MNKFIIEFLGTFFLVLIIGLSQNPLAIGLGLDQAAKILGDMASVYFVSVAAIVAAFFGSQAIVKGKK